MLKESTCCFTGHRNIPKDQISLLKTQVRNSMEILIQKGYRNFCSGGALGFDTLAAQLVLESKQYYNNIHLSMILPCKEQDKYWTSSQKELYFDILKEADQIIYTSDNYYKGCMCYRNRFLVDSSSCVIAYLESNAGGTKYTVNYAEKKGIPVFFIGNKPQQLSFLY